MPHQQMYSQSTEPKIRMQLELPAPTEKAYLHLNSTTWATGYISKDIHRTHWAF